MSDATDSGPTPSGMEPPDQADDEEFSKEEIAEATPPNAGGRGRPRSGCSAGTSGGIERSITATLERRVVKRGSLGTGDPLRGMPQVQFAVRAPVASLVVLPRHRGHPAVPSVSSDVSRSSAHHGEKVELVIDMDCGSSGPRRLPTSHR